MISKLMKPLVLSKARKIYKECSPFLGRKVLDVGAGRCFIAREIKRRKGCDVTCIDVEDLNETNLELVVYDGKKIPFKDNSFDSVLLVYVLHHCEKPEEVLKEAARVSKGNIIIFEDIDSPLTRFSDYVVNKILHGVDCPFNFKSNKAWKRLFEDLGLKLKKAKRGVEKAWYYPVEHIMYIVDV